LLERKLTREKPPGTSREVYKLGSVKATSP
jgi:hypothetical protein